MTPADWHRAKTVFAHAAELPAAERAGYLDQACGDDTTLRREVESLLAALDQDAGALETPAAAWAGLGAAAPSRVGPYELVREIGRGGMGAVYLAVRADDQYRKQVAVKLMEPSLHAKELEERFRHERQILAELEHPNVARLIDGGVAGGDGGMAAGLPYFVLEYVDGVPIDDYAAAAKLTVRQRVELFLPVCAAVEYAHRHLIVHRDLKPANILVTREGVPKLLDFGIAKLLSAEGRAEAGLTRTGVRLMTPEYASPEQVRGDPISISTDVYALGVVLYELLTGQRPYRPASNAVHEMARVILEQEPDPPERIVPELRGDLEKILRMALRKDPGRRYGTVAELADDLRRYLANRPVRARPDTLRYRAGKFIARNKAGTAAAALALLSLTGGLAGALWQARVASEERHRAEAEAAIAREERGRAERRFAEVRRLANSFLFEFHDAIENLPGATAARQLVVRKAVEHLDGLAREAGNDPELTAELATAYLRIGNVQGGAARANLGDLAGAAASYRKAAELLEGMPDRPPLDLGREVLLREVRLAQAAVSAASGRLTEALSLYRKLIGELRELERRFPGHARLRIVLAESLIATGAVLGFSGAPNLGRPAEAIGEYRQGVALLAGLLARQPGDRDLQRRTMLARSKLAGAIATVQGAQAALPELEATFRLASALAEGAGHDARALDDLVTARGMFAAALNQTHQEEKALPLLGANIELAERISAADAKDAKARRAVFVALENYGQAYFQTEKFPQALAAFERARTVAQELAAADPANAVVRRDLRRSHSKVAMAAQETGDLERAIAGHQEALRLAREEVAREPGDAAARRDVAFETLFLGSVHEAMAERPGVANAAEHLREAIAWFESGLELAEGLRAAGAMDALFAGAIPQTREHVKELRKKVEGGVPKQ
jgi:non-specific serine/threonine protein kinase/serine/threonine-protein kinase